MFCISLSRYVSRGMLTCTTVILLIISLNIVMSLPCLFRSILIALILELISYELEKNIQFSLKYRTNFLTRRPSYGVSKAREISEGGAGRQRGAALVISDRSGTRISGPRFNFYNKEIMLLRHWSREDAIGDDSAHEPTWLVDLLHQFPHFDAKLQAVRWAMTTLSYLCSMTG